MKRTFCAIAAIAGLLIANTVMGQESEATDTKKKSRVLTISNKGICFDNVDSGKTKSHKATKVSDQKAGKVKLTFAMLDLGLNSLNDNTIYTDPAVINYLNVPGSSRNAELFDTRPAKSINVNFTPIGLKFLAVKTKNQRLYISTGLGLQVYNFRYEQDISYRKSPNRIEMDTISFSKNKLAVTYLSVPLMVTAKSRLHKDTWLIYGAGVSAGYRIITQNKQISDERGKVKNHGSFGLADYNTCVTGEFGVEGIIRFFASYQLTSLYGSNNIDQRPISFGIRIGGV